MVNDSKCPKNFFCDFRTSRDLPDAVVRVCVACGKKVIYRKDAHGRIDNKKFLKDNVRETVQPWGKTRKLFLQIYGGDKLAEFEKSMDRVKTKKQMAQEWEEMRHDLRNRFSKNSIQR